MTTNEKFNAAEHATDCAWQAELERRRRNAGFGVSTTYYGDEAKARLADLLDGERNRAERRRLKRLLAWVESGPSSRQRATYRAPMRCRRARRSPRRRTVRVAAGGGGDSDPSGSRPHPGSEVRR